MTKLQTRVANSPGNHSEQVFAFGRLGYQVRDEIHELARVPCCGEYPRWAVGVQPGQPVALHIPRFTGGLIIKVLNHFDELPRQQICRERTRCRTLAHVGAVESDPG